MFNLAVTLLLALFASVLANDGLVRSSIFSISPDRGSVEGGTRVVIKGTGFSRAGLDGSVLQVFHLLAFQTNNAFLTELPLFVWELKSA